MLRRAATPGWDSLPSGCGKIGWARHFCLCSCSDTCIWHIFTPSCDHCSLTKNMERQNLVSSSSRLLLLYPKDNSFTSKKRQELWLQWQRILERYQSNQATQPWFIFSRLWKESSPHVLLMPNKMRRCGVHVVRSDLFTTALQLYTLYIYTII